MDLQFLDKARNYSYLDINCLKELLSGNKRPADKILELVSKGELIRLKRGIYILPPGLGHKPLCREIIANILYGPSYISKEYALSHYGLIPERVETVTCMTTGRNKEFQTPIGRFTYTYLKTQAYAVGLIWKKMGELRCLMATPEKAIADVIAQIKDFKNPYEVYEHLTENMRIDEDQVKSLNRKRLREIAEHYKSRSIFYLLQYLEKSS